MKTLKEYFPASLEGTGIFTEIAKTEWFPGMDPAACDTYFYLRCGNKNGFEELLNNFVDSSGHVTGDKLTKLAKVIYNTYIINWRNIYRDLTAQYNPIENTDYVETTKEKTLSTAESSSSSEGSNENSNSNANDKYAFNSSTQPQHDTASTGSSTDTTSASSETSSEGNTDFEREFRRHGNIGVQTAGEIITRDLPIWLGETITDHFISDICNLIALSIY